MKRIIYVILACAMLSCDGLKQVTVSKKQRFYNLKAEAGSGIFVSENTKPFKAVLREETDGVYFKTLDQTDIQGKGTFPIPGGGYEYSFTKSISIPPAYFFSTSEALTDQTSPSAFSYRQWRPYLQGMSIPLKFRGKLDEVTWQQ